MRFIARATPPGGHDDSGHAVKKNRISVTACTEIRRPRNSGNILDKAASNATYRQLSVQTRSTCGDLPLLTICEFFENFRLSCAAA